MDSKPKPVFEKSIFWDVDFEQLDYDANANFIIERVFERGDVEDIRQCRRYYGDEKVTNALLKTKYLPEHRIHLASAVIDKPLNEFRCYILRQLNPGLFPY
jgi:nicotinamide mononucleotide adenylyltransferase